MSVNPKKTSKKVIKITRVSAKKKTAKAQAKRKIEGTVIERKVARDLEKQFPLRSMRINSRSGIDIILKNGKMVNIEVKSARARIYENRIRKTDGKNRKFTTTRPGRFYIKQADYLNADLFAFVVKPVNPITLNWDRNRKLRIKYVEAENVRLYLKATGRFKKHKVTKIDVNVVQQFPNADLKKIIKR